MEIRRGVCEQRMIDSSKGDGCEIRGEKVKGKGDM